MKWIKTGREVRLNGESTVYYEAVNAPYSIESRKRAIRHANGAGHWMHTSYFLIFKDGTEKEYYSLKDAKEAAERFEMEGENQ